MSIGAVIVIAIVIWWVVSSGRATKARQLTERRAELETWEHHEGGVNRRTYRLHFPTMRLVVHLAQQRTVSEARRIEGGKWETRETAESRREQLREAEEKLSELKDDKDDRWYRVWELSVEQLKKEAEWTRVDDSMNTAIEAAYQRFIHQRP